MIAGGSIVPVVTPVVGAQEGRQTFKEGVKNASDVRQMAKGLIVGRLYKTKRILSWTTEVKGKPQVLEAFPQ
jgi:hypothetical protein